MDSAGIYVHTVTYIYMVLKKIKGMFPFLCSNTRVVKVHLFQKRPMDLTGGDDQIHPASSQKEMEGGIPSHILSISC